MSRPMNTGTYTHADVVLKQMRSQRLAYLKHTLCTYTGQGASKLEARLQADGQYWGAPTILSLLRELVDTGEACLESQGYRRLIHG